MIVWTHAVLDVCVCVLVSHRKCEHARARACVCICVLGQRVCVSVRVFVCVCVCGGGLGVCLCVCVCVLERACACLSFCLSVWLSFSLSVCVYFYVYKFICVTDGLHWQKLLRTCCRSFHPSLRSILPTERSEKLNCTVTRRSGGTGDPGWVMMRIIMNQPPSHCQCHIEPKVGPLWLARRLRSQRDREREGGGLLFVSCLTSQLHASVSQGRICSDNFTCCHTEVEAADQAVYLTQSQYTDTGPTSPSTDPITPGVWQGSHWSANF